MVEAKLTIQELNKENLQLKSDLKVSIYLSILHLSMDKYIYIFIYLHTDRLESTLEKS